MSRDVRACAQSHPFREPSEFLICRALYPWELGASLFGWGPKTPLNALMSGPTVGGPWEDGDDSPRSVSVDYFELACPEAERYFISRKSVLDGLGDMPDGVAVFDQLLRLVRDAPSRCVEVGRVGEEPTFDVWLISGNRSLGLSLQFLDTPTSRLLGASPLVQSAILRNEYLYELRSQPSTDTPANGDILPRANMSPSPNVYPRMMAIHLRRGDFERACRYHTNRPDVWYQWNLWPTLPDTFVPHPEAGGGYAPAEAYEAVRKRCFPNPDEVLQRVRQVRDEYLLKGSPKSPTVDAMHIMTNGDRHWIDELKLLLEKDGWTSVVSSDDLKLDDEQTDVSMAIDMEIGRRAAVFIGNGVSHNFHCTQQRLTSRSGHHLRATSSTDVSPTSAIRTRPGSGDRYHSSHFHLARGRPDWIYP